MPTIAHGSVEIDYIDEGTGPVVILLHSSVSGNRQWSRLIDDLKHRYRFLAINLFGYGKTTVWPGGSAQSLYAQAQLVSGLCMALLNERSSEQPNEQSSDQPKSQFENVSLVGHSFGGSVALKVAMLAELNVQNLVLLEPNPFWLLLQQNRLLAYEEARALRDHVKFYGGVGDWPVVAARFADYWLGSGTWKSMPDKRRAAFLEALVPNFHEWDAVMDESSALEQIGGIAANTLLVSDPHTVLPIREIAGLFVERFSHWRFCSVAGAGHMAPVTNPDLINPIIADFMSLTTLDSVPTEH